MHITRVFGPPGTGKTTYLINKVQDELQNGVLPNEIMYTSFTRTAAHEARDRALVKFTKYIKSDFPWFSTIHAICFKLLDLKRENVFTGNQLKEFCTHYSYSISDQSNGTVDEITESDMPSTILSTAADYYEHFIGWMRNCLLDFNTAFTLFTNNGGLPDGFSVDQLRLYIERRNDYKRQLNLYDFCDMIEIALTGDYYPNTVKVMISDESQDLSPMLFTLTTQWGSHMERVYLGADPYQAVYQFMGADPTLFINTKSDTDIRLTQSHRCSVAIHDISRKLVSRFNTRYPNDDFTPTPNQGAVSWQIPEAINWPELKGHVFYLHRTNYLVSKVYEELIAQGVAFQVPRGKKSPLQRNQAKAVHTLMQLIDGKNVPLTEILKLMEFIPSKSDKGTYLKIGSKAAIKELIVNHPAGMVMLKDLPDLGFSNFFIQQLNHENVFVPLNMEKSDKNYFERLIHKYGYGILTAEPPVTVATMHAVKGRECDTVILNTNLTGKTYDALMRDPEPEHRLFYVAVTRAKTRLMILESDGYMGYKL